MSDWDQHIKRINEKLQQLLKRHQQLQKDNLRQQKQIEELQAGNKKDAEIISGLQEKVSILKAAAGKMNETDKKAFEKNINRYIREIDKCITLLSE